MNKETDTWCQVVRSGMKERKQRKVLEKAQGGCCYVQGGDGLSEEVPGEMTFETLKK